MSSTAGGGDSPPVTDYAPERQCPTRVFINGTRVPAAETDVYIRKEGPLSVTRYAEATFVSPWNGEDYLTLVDTLEGDQDAPDTLRIDTYVGTTDSHHPLFNGVVTGAGSSPQHDNENMFLVRSQGPGHYLTNIPASKTFNGRGIDALTVLEYITETLDDALPADISLSDAASEAESADESVEVGPPEASLDNINLLPGKELLYSPKTFQANKHDLSHVVGWLQEKIGGRLWIEPTTEGGTIVLTDTPTQSSVTHKSHDLDDGETKVIRNNALEESNPINTVIVNGRAKRTLAEVGDFEVNVPNDEFVKVKTRHKLLYQTAGEIEMAATVRKSDAESEQEVINEAKSKLKHRVDESTAGSIYVEHDTQITPFDTIIARPTTHKQPDTDVPAITYEVDRAHYMTRPNENSVIPHIELNVGVKTDMEDDIEIVRTWKKDA